MGTISKDFSYREFEASPTAERKGICNVITTAAVRDAVKELVEKVLQPLRDRVGHPLRINSGYRCPELNRAVGGVATSQHVKGEAADIAAEDPHELAKVVRDTPEIWREVDQMILYPTFVHFSHRKGGPQRRQLLYNKSYKGEKF
nr:MAG TPA: peptidase [Caudoviricetes sp.]